MPLMATATIEVETHSDAGKETTYDFTPDDRKIFARTVTVKQGRAEVVIAETERDDPTSIYLGAYIRDAGMGVEAELSLSVSAKDLDELIEALTLARDTAITEWMLEPAG